MPNEPRTGYIQIQGEKLFYESIGDRLPVLLLHAGVANSRMWDPQFEAMANSYRVLRCDLRGFGNSPYPNGPFFYHADIAGLLNATEIRSAWIVGTSFGGRVAVDFCLGHPQLVRGLVLVSPLISGYEAQDQIRTFAKKEDDLLKAGKLEEAVELNLQMWIDGPNRTPKEVPAELRSKVAEMQLQAFKMPVPENVKLERFDSPALKRLHEINVPMLIVVGELDVAEVLTHADELAQGIRGARRVIIPGAAHLVSMEKPEDFNQLVLNFMGENEAEL